MVADFRSGAYLGGFSMHRLLLALLCLIISFLLAACGVTATLDHTLDALQGYPDQYEDSDLYAYEDAAEQLAEDTTYHNPWLEFYFTVPAGWWKYETDANNFPEHRAPAAEQKSPDISDYGEYSYMYLGRFGSMHYSSRNSHIGVTLYAERYTSTNTLDSFMTAYDEKMQARQENGITYSLAEIARDEINGREFAIHTFTVGQADRDYQMAAYCCAMNDGYFLIMEADYWPDNSDAPGLIRALIENNLELTANSPSE
jgi:hypothetical protein